MTEGILAALAKLFSFAGLKLVLTTIIIYIEYMIGGFDLVTRGLLMLMLLDFAMGFTNAWRNHCVSRRKLKDGLYKFLLYAVTIMTGHWTDIIVFHQTVEFGFQNGLIVYL
jgi:phage-related holin